MKEIFLLFPNQLYRETTAISPIDQFCLIEDPLFFKQYNFHLQKLAFHRASMKKFQLLLERAGKAVYYIDAANLDCTTKIFCFLPNTIKKVYLYETDDFDLKKKLISEAKHRSIEILFLENPGFILPLKDNINLLSSNSNYLLAKFYQSQRLRFKILLDGNKPKFGKWSFDSDNRKKMPVNLTIPNLAKCKQGSIEREAIAYTRQHFPNNPGTLKEIIYPTDHQQAKQSLDLFLAERFANFGTYQDAITKSSIFNFHSVLSPLINSGLLDPMQTINSAISYAEQNGIGYNNLEGFTRQILGWREYVRGIYHLIGRKQRCSNFWKHQRPLPKSFYLGTTSIQPFDDSIKKVLDTGYCHHIERLMILANLMTLCEIKPDAVYQWFMELFIDAYDWVMVPNVYGMGIFADGGLIVTKPYISSSNYILKMSDYQKDGWAETWDSLYWRFMHKHQDFFSANPRLSVISSHLKKMPAEKLTHHLNQAENFLSQL